jgi:murein DD-endopeptidase MepM/ murein hydrolase activator NlpD
VEAFKPQLKVGAVLIFAAILAGCFNSSPAAVETSHTAIPIGSHATHVVARGETIYRIAHQYGLSTDRLMQANGINDPRQLTVGQVLVIPERSVTASSDAGFAEQWVPPRADRQFAWPVDSGTVSSPFGIRNGVMHDGVDISAPAGTPVNAADDGVVIFCGHMRGYGNVVILQHTNGYVTVYGHNQRNLVSNGESVKRGQEIGELGSTGRASAPNLHFEVRCDNHPANPLAYLPPPEPQNGIRFARSSLY